MNTTTEQTFSPTGAGGAIAVVAGAIARALLTSKALALTALLLLLSRILFHGGNRKQRVGIFPPWAVLEIAATAHFVTAGGVMRHVFSLFRRNSGSMFGFTAKHQVLYDFHGVDHLFTQQGKSLDMFDAGWTMCIKIFGLGWQKTQAEMDEVLTKAYKCFRPLYGPVEKMFVNEQNATKAVERMDVPGNALNLVTFSTREEDMKPWEKSSDVRVVSPGRAAEVELHHLLRDFGACITIPVLYHQDFLDRNPTFLQDFWKFDNELFALRIIGAPYWLPIKGFQEGLAGRTRCNEAMEGLYARIDQWQKGLPVDGGADMSDVSVIAQERNRIFDEVGMPTWARGRIDFSLVWAQNANSQATAFWLVAHIYSTPGLLKELREEIDEFVKVDERADPPRITAFDIPALSRECPLLKSAFFETLRVCNEGTSIRYVREAVTVEDQNRKYVLQPGTWISAPHGARQHDPAVYPDPDKFVPDRFIETDVQTGKRVARYGNLRPWGTGLGICKGRTLAEKEILALAAAIMSLWDMEPAGGRQWKMPGMRMNTGVMAPTEEMRVVLRRRVFA